jgi:hypothetical protein
MKTGVSVEKGRMEENLAHLQWEKMSFPLGRGKGKRQTSVRRLALARQCGRWLRPASLRRRAHERCLPRYTVVAS